MVMTIVWPPAPIATYAPPAFPDSEPLEVGGYVEDSAGEIIRDSDGNPLEWTQ